MNNRIIIGSANFNQVYGIKKNFISKKEIKKLFNFALKRKIRTIDTSPLYGKSEKIIGLVGNNRFRIISKIPNPPRKLKKKNIKKWLENVVMISKKNLKIKKFECLLIHDAKLLLNKKGEEIYKHVKSLQKKGITNKIGVSVYDFNILEKILKKFKPNLIQAPLNIFDRRLIEKKWLDKLHKKKIKIHVRSIFLQGTLLLNHNDLPKKLKKFRKIWIRLEEWRKKKNITALQACISFALCQKKLNGIVVGVNNRKQLIEMLSIKKKNIVIPNLKIRNNKLIDPRKWTS